MKTFLLLCLAFLAARRVASKECHLYPCNNQVCLDGPDDKVTQVRVLPRSIGSVMMLRWQCKRDLAAGYQCFDGQRDACTSMHCTDDEVSRMSQFVP